jgi:DNA polymerase I-like protein with 3'-5' exonuclease and polymerase domains
VLLVHDEILVEAPAAEAKNVKEIVVKCMIESGQELIKKVPIGVDANICDSWAEKQNILKSLLFL